MAAERLFPKIIMRGGENLGCAIPARAVRTLAASVSLDTEPEGFATLSMTKLTLSLAALLAFAIVLWLTRNKGKRTRLS